MNAGAALEFAFALQVAVGPPLVLGRVGAGERRIVPILGGTVAGPRLSGSVLPGGADWQVVHDDGLTEVEARYWLRLDDGLLVSVINRGLRHGPADVMASLARGETVDASAYYFRTAPVFDLAAGRHEWLRRSVFVGFGARLASEVRIDVHRVA